MQRVSGANLAFIVSESDGSFDASGTLTASPNGGLYWGRWRINLQADTAIVPLVDVAITLYYSPDGVNWEEYTSKRGLEENNVTFINPAIWRTLAPMPGFENKPQEVNYSFQLVAWTAARVRFKVQAVGTDDVTIAIERLV